MLSKNELRYLLALQRVPNLGDISSKKLLQFVGSAEGIFKEKKSNLLKIDGIGAIKLKDLSESHLLRTADRELEYIKANDISISYFKDETYPERLKYCVDSPLLFFSRGNIDFRNSKVISIVGTRRMTDYGKDSCESIIEELSPLNPIIISGFAYGIDITAHKAALNNGLQTIACLAHGFNQIYPRVHRKYTVELEKNGGFISEFWSSDDFERTNFLKRNRIIAGLSEATIVIESAAKGGSLVTADIANSYSREVFAVPGRTSDLQSCGCNDLIKTNQARLLSSAADLIYMMGWKIESPKNISRQTELFVELTEDEKIVFKYLKETEKELLDVIALECKFPINKTASLLLQMELKGIVRPLPGKLFQLIP